MLSPSRRVCFYVFNLFACQQAFAKLNSIKDISLRAHYSNIFEIVINMFYAPFVYVCSTFLCVLLDCSYFVYFYVYFMYLLVSMCVWHVLNKLNSNLLDRFHKFQLKGGTWAEPIRFWYPDDVTLGWGYGRYCTWLYAAGLCYTVSHTRNTAWHSSHKAFNTSLWVGGAYLPFAH